MASSPKVDYKEVKNYVVKFGHSNEIDILFLCYNVDRNFQFVSIKTGAIYNLAFETIEEAEKWLYSFSNVLTKDLNMFINPVKSIEEQILNHN